MNKELSAIMDAYWEDFVKHRDDDFIVKPSIPIIWFGDMENYMKSKMKVVTVAINPSSIEFKCEKKEKSLFEEDNSFFRFPGAEDIWCLDRLDNYNKDTLYNSLNNYFENKPYKPWFLGFEKPLNVINASYYTDQKMINRAIHIDICTALATVERWSKVSAIKKARITGYELFKMLIKYLQPNIILYTAKKEHLMPTFGIDDKKDVDSRFQKYENNYNDVIEIYKFNRTLIIYGRNNNWPFNIGDNWVRERLIQIMNNAKYKEYFNNV